MAGEDRSGWDNRTIADVLAIVLGLAFAALAVLTANDRFLLLGSYGILSGTSTAVVTGGLLWFTGERVGPSSAAGGASLSDVVTGRALETESDAKRDTGWLIGRLENVIVLTLVYAGEFTALSIVFAAKSFVRHEDISSDDTAYYLAGTLLNFTYSIAVGIAALWLADARVLP